MRIFREHLGDGRHNKRMGRCVSGLLNGHICCQ
jgi:hypothetical protein